MIRREALCVAVICSLLVGCGSKSPPKSEAAKPGATEEPMRGAQPAALETSPAPSPPPAATDRTGEQATQAPAEPKAEPPKAEPLTDAQIIMITELANSGEIEQAKVAQTKAKDPAVRKFAAMMIEDHGKAKQKQAKLATKLKLKPAESPPAVELKSDAASALSTLKSTPKADFERAYMEKQVDAHRRVLELLDKRLLPSATDPELKALLGEMRPIIEHHLKEAESIQSALESAPAPAGGVSPPKGP